LERLGGLLNAVPDRRAAEDHLLALPRGRLLWRAQVALAGVIDGLARRRGDAQILAAEPARASCLGRLRWVGLAGRLPHLDLEASLTAAALPGRVTAASGCRLTVPALAAHAGVQVLRGEVESAGGAHVLALDFPGPALWRVDGGAWHAHESAAIYGPRWSAASLQL